MNKNKFLELIRGYPTLSSEELREIEEVTIAYPYVQIGHALSAKASDNIHSPKAPIKLKYAAVYTAERSVLRSLMQNEIQLGPGSEPARKELPRKEAAEKRETITQTKSRPKPVAQDDVQNRKHRERMERLYAEMESNLKDLQEFKFRFFEENPEDFEEELKKKSPEVPSEVARPPQAAGETPAAEESAVHDKEPENQTTPEATKELRSKEEPGDLAGSAPVHQSPQQPKAQPEEETQPEPEIPPEPESHQIPGSQEQQPEQVQTDGPGEESQPMQVSDSEGEGQTDRAEESVNFLEELQGKESLPDPNSKLKEQIKIIDDFIEVSSKLANLTPAEDDKNKEDLSQPSTIMGDDLVSENLANIFIRQGKVKDAIEIYKKLIWKFPQKQSYFAALIEELKNE